MHYSFFFTIEPGNDVDNPVVETIKLASGVLRGVKIHFPVGCNGCARCCVLNDSKQLLPTNSDGFYALDGDSVNAPLWYDLSVNSNVLYFVGWSYGAEFDHDISVLLDVKEDNEPDMVMLQAKISEVIDHLISMIKSYL